MGCGWQPSGQGCFPSGSRGVDRGLRGRIGKVTRSEVRIGKMAKRIFVEKKADFQIKAEALRKELTHNLQLTSLTSVRLVQVYDVFNLEEDLLEQAIKHIFTEQVTDKVLSEAELDLAEALILRLRLFLGSLISESPAVRRPFSYWAVVRRCVSIQVSSIS